MTEAILGEFSVLKLSHRFVSYILQRLENKNGFDYLFDQLKTHISMHFFKNTIDICVFSVKNRQIRFFTLKWPLGFVQEYQLKHRVQHLRPETQDEH